MRVDLTAYEFVAISNELNRCNSVVSDKSSDGLDVLDAMSRRAGMLVALELLGFEVAVDDRGRVIDIAQAFISEA